MSYFDQLNRRVLEAIRSGRVGRPVFVRLLAGVPPGQAENPLSLLQMLAAVRGWVGSSIDRVHAAETPDRSHTSTTLQFRGGATALVSTVPASQGRVRFDLLVLGNHGSICHEGLTSSASDGFAVSASTLTEDVRLREAIDKSLRSGQPEPVQAREER